ncbi:GTPase-activating protein gyp7-like [Heracleum sosnowskyi]|uniref:GTPase-activating protein gyp7-like n=1 Tax=Heracleum sosnowskyi TaxID=360622 RepID=A0AAD8N798_9APIA|nr:GTPase-activating protein gyp7-like [Heracleum sosnowskyi]
MLLRYLIVKFSDVLPGGSADAKLLVSFTAVIGIVIAAAFICNNRGHLKSPWALSKRKKALSTEQWRLLFTPEGKFHDGGVRFLKTVRRGGVDPGIRAEVWPFLLGVYELNSSEEERRKLRTKKRKEYGKLRRRCQQLIEFNNNLKVNEVSVAKKSGNDKRHNHVMGSADSEEVCSRESPRKEMNPSADYSDDISSALLEKDAASRTATVANTCKTESVKSDSNSDSSVERSQTFTSTEGTKKKALEVTSKENVSNTEIQLKFTKKEDFITWQQIIRVDAIRANREWIPYSPTLAAVSNERARSLAEAVGLKEYDNLEPCMIFHAARLVALLEAYCLYDPEVGYCQGMSDLLSPIITVITEDHDAFWCFVRFMKKARYNFKLDEVGIKRQLSKVSMIIKCKDSQLFHHLEMLQADDCFFVYRMVVVLFRRELTFEQTICLWEVMWADQAAIRAGIGYSVWSRIRHLALPTEDLLLYAVAASILQRRKLIIERYSSMDEIMTECHSMAGHLDVWKLLDDAHNLVFSLRDKVETPF